MITQLHDIAVIYLGLAHGADGDLDPAEARAIATRLRAQQPHQDPALIDHVMREATLTYANGRAQSVERAVESLKSLPEEERSTLLQDLSTIAQADHKFMDEEKTFIEHISERWGMNPA